MIAVLATPKRPRTTRLARRAPASNSMRVKMKAAVATSRSKLLGLIASVQGFPIGSLTEEEFECLAEGYECMIAALDVFDDFWDSSAGQAEAPANVPLTFERWQETPKTVDKPMKLLATLAREVYILSVDAREWFWTSCKKSDHSVREEGNRVELTALLQESTEWLWKLYGGTPPDEEELESEVQREESDEEEEED